MNCILTLTASLMLLGAQVVDRQIEPAKIRVRGVELHYIEQGRGEPIILLPAGFDNLSPEALAAVMQDSASFKVLTLSSDPFPNLSSARVGRLSIPVMIVTGENTIKIHRLVNEQLASVLPNCKSAIIPNAGHGSRRENPQAFNEAVLTFSEILRDEMA